MNNSLTIELSQEKEDTRYQEREAELVRLIDAIKGLEETREWSTLKEALFDGLVERLEAQLRNEAERPELNSSALYRLQGQLSWARTYADLGKLAKTYHAELVSIRKNKNPPTAGEQA